VGEIEGDRVEAAAAFARGAGVCVVLKGAPTVIGEPEGRAFINSTGNPGMATAGAGDVLTGVIASFIGQGLAPVEASALGVYLHGLAGDIAASCVGGHSLIATDITEALPRAFSTLRGENG
jgi:NAD(P)H-hydrate epimerase